VIDFRYHLVSLVSVFMALAIGVVLGAGPLNESLGDTLNNQVQSLRTDKEALQQAVDNRDADIAAQDEYIAAIASSVAAEQLTGRSVTVVSLPGAVAQDVEAVTAQIAAAGGTVTSVVAVQPRWTDPAEAAFRSELAGQLVQYINPRPSAELGTDGELGVLLSRALVTTGPVPAERDADGVSILEGLQAAELVTVTEDAPALAELAVVVAGTPEEAAGAEDPEWVERENGSYLALLTELDAASAGTTLAGPVGSDGNGLVAELRAEALLTEEISTVDGVGTAAGRLSVILALRQQAAGQAGQYGTGEGAQAVLPPIEAPAGSVEPGPQEPTAEPTEEPTAEPTGSPSGDG